MYASGYRYAHIKNYHGPPGALIPLVVIRAIAKQLCAARIVSKHGLTA